MAGATAVGGGDLTVVVDVEFESVVLLDVESVTMGSIAHADDAIRLVHKTNNSCFFIFAPAGVFRPGQYYQDEPLLIFKTMEPEIN